MAWENKKGLSLRSTVAFVSDAAGTIGIPGSPAQATNNPAYTPGSNSVSPVTLDSDTFNCGWTTGNVDGARDRTTGVDHRLAGRQGSLVGSNTFQIQCGRAPGTYKIWLGFTDQTNGTGSTTISCTISDANGTLATVSSAALTANQVTGADGTIYTNAAAWAATADTTGVGITVNTTDTSNGNGGPLLKFLCPISVPLAFVGVQFFAPNALPLMGQTLT